MAIADKIVDALVRALKAEYVQLDDDDGISGFVVSRQFKGMSSLDRQARIEAALGGASLTPEEQRRVLLIAGLTPVEFDSVGARIRVHKIKEKAAGAVEVLLRGGRAEAEYVRRTLLSHQEDLRTTKPKPVEGAIGVMMSFQAKGNKSNPLTRDKVIPVLKKDRYIEVAANA